MQNTTTNNTDIPISALQHRVQVSDISIVSKGRVVYSIKKSFWILFMSGAAIVGGMLSFSWAAFTLFLTSTAFVLLFGHSLGSHRKFIHNSFACPKWLEYLLVYLGVQVGLAGPIGLLKQHELRDFAQRLPNCHDFLRHGQPMLTDAWWQLHCDLELENSPTIQIEDRIASDRFYRFLENTWMWQQAPIAVLFYFIGGWGFVFWGVCARVATGVLGHWLIGYFAHNHGGLQYKVKGAAVQGRNIRFTSLLTMGESWHNNHHAFPGSARLGLNANEWDPGWWTLCALKRCGLVWDIKLPKDLEHRPELREIQSKRNKCFILIYLSS